MNARTLRSVLRSLGWQDDGDFLVSPGGSLWISASDMDGDTSELYASVARRAEVARTNELITQLEDHCSLLAALSGDPMVKAMLAQHQAAKDVFQSWSRDRGMTLSFWDFSRASVRGTARHPTNGIACIEWILQDVCTAQLFLYHWIDDYDSERRYSWMMQLRAMAPEDGGLRRQLDDAAHLLLAQRNHDVYSISPISTPQKGSILDIQALDIFR